MVDRTRGASAPTFRSPALAAGPRATQQATEAAPVAATPGPRPLASRRSEALHIAIGPNGKPVDPEYVRVLVRDQEVSGRALRAKMDRGLVIAKRVDPGPSRDAVDGIYSDAFASCVAVILQSPDAIGLAHTSLSGLDVPSFIRQCRMDFLKHSHPPRTMTLGYNPRGWTDDMVRDPRPFEALYEDRPKHFRGLWRLELGRKETASHTDAERRKRLIDGVRFNHARWVAHLANLFHTSAVELPHAAVLVPRALGQPLVMFDAEPEAFGVDAAPDLKSRPHKRLRDPERPLDDPTSRPRPVPAHSWAPDSLAALETMLLRHEPEPGPTAAGEPIDRKQASYPAGMPSLGAADPSAQTPGIPVRVFAGTTRLCSQALMAEMGEGLVTARRRDAIDGLYSDGFASCVAVVLVSDTLIGLAHLVAVGDDLREGVADLRAGFEALVVTQEGRTHAPVRLTLGYSPRALRRQLAEEAAEQSVDAFIRSNECFTQAGYESLIRADEVLHLFWKGATPPRVPKDAERRDYAIRSFLNSKRNELTAIPMSELIELPHAALLVRPDGSIDTFEQSPRHERL